MTAAERNNRKRAWLWRKLKKSAHERLKFSDESGVTTLFTRLFGRAAPGARVVEAVPNNYGQSTAVVSLIGIGGVEPTRVSAGAVDTLVCAAFCAHFLRPCLPAGDSGGLDNLGAHRARGIEETARAGKATVMWLPPYSPDFSPLEPRGAKWKTYVRKVKARTTEDRDRAVAAGLQLITEHDCRSWVKHGGYKVA